MMFLSGISLLECKIDSNKSETISINFEVGYCLIFIVQVIFFIAI